MYWFSHSFLQYQLLITQRLQWVVNWISVSKGLNAICIIIRRTCQLCGNLLSLIQCLHLGWLKDIGVSASQNFLTIFSLWEFMKKCSHPIIFIVVLKCRWTPYSILYCNGIHKHVASNGDHMISTWQNNFDLKMFSIIG